ncbi:MAG: hypothetical protein LBQ47_00175 [Endomicrobium sp.]|jgi:3-deoxy-D-manno-octulosonic-acid transferase|nr:hypothetical protein [Endomicrobium sp.]
MTTIFLFIYNLFFISLLIPASLLLLIFSSKYRKEIFYKLPERFALWNYSKNSSKKTIWIHCASLGEVRAVEPVIEGLKDDFFIVLTALTKSAREYAQKMNKAHFCALLPLDIYPLVLKAFKIVKPDVFVIVETELWVSSLCGAKRAGAKIMTVNGRMSEKSFKMYKKLRFFWRPFIKLIDYICARTAADAQRFAFLSGKTDNISVGGNVKYDRDFKVNSKRSDFGLKDGGIVFTAGSTRDFEEEIIAQSYVKIKKSYPDIKFFLAPRHLSRLGEVKKILAKYDISYSLFSQKQDGKNFILVDVFGKLQSVYAVSDISFVGGSLVNKGGQNPIEPAAYAKPVLFGPYMENFETEADVLLKYGGAFKVLNADEIVLKIIELVCNKELRIKAGENAAKAVESQKGAVKRTVEKIREEAEKSVN